MDIYEKVKDNQITVTKKLFKQMIKSLFRHRSNKNIYSTVIKYILSNDTEKDKILDDIPLFYATFLKNPSQFKEFINEIHLMMKQLSPSNFVVYKGANIITLMTCAVFHISKLYTMIPSNTYEDAALYFHTPLSDFIIDIFQYTDINKIDFKQQLDGFLNTYQYLLLMSFVSSFVQMDERPLFNFLHCIYHNYEDIEFKLDPVDDIVKLLIEKKEDLYGFDVLSEYDLSDGLQTVRNNSLINIKYFQNDEGISIFTYYEASIDEFIDYTIDKTADLYGWIEHKITPENFGLLLYLNKIALTFLYDKDDNDCIVNDYKWQSLLKHIWYALENSDDLSRDINEIIVNIDTDNSNSDLFILKDKNETILHAMLHNKFIERFDATSKNMKFIVEFFKAIITGNYTGLNVLKTYVPRVFKNEYLYVFNKDGKDVLLLFLQNLFEDRDHNVSLNSISSKSPAFFCNTKSIYSSNSEEDIKIIKRIIDEILKHNFKFFANEMIKEKLQNIQPAIMTQYLKSYFKNLYRYNDNLLEMKIDLKKHYYINKYIYSSPESISTATVRSVDRETNENSLSRLPENDDILKNRHYVDKKLQEKMAKIYVRTVQSDTDEKNNYNRINVIRKYLIKKYKHSFDYIVDYEDFHKILNVERKKELEAFYDFWESKLNKGNLNVPFIVRYKNSVGQDAGGVTKQFLTNVSKQLISYFTLVEHSKRYKLNAQVTADMANFIGQVIGILIIYDVSLPFGLSMVYLGHMMFKAKHLSVEELFLYYLLDLDRTSRKQYVEGSEMPTESGEALCTPQDVVNDYMPDKYNHTGTVFKSFLKGFFLEHKLFYRSFYNIKDKIRMYDVDKLLSSIETSELSMKRYVFENLNLIDTNDEPIDIDQREAEVFRFLRDLMIVDTQAEYDRYFNAYTAEPEMMTRKALFKTKMAFCDAILMFWTGVENVTMNEPYIVIIDKASENIYSHTCPKVLELPLATHIKTKSQLYNVFMTLFIYDEQNNFTLA
jgi:hypothetical protein